MAHADLEMAAKEVLKGYSCVGPFRQTYLGNARGFSGSRIWQIHREYDIDCLKAWPVQFQDSQRLRQIHCWMDGVESDCWEFVPDIWIRKDFRTWIRHAGRLWELAKWMPGRADFYKTPSLPRLQSGCRSLALLHKSWAKEQLTAAPPSLLRRIEGAQEWNKLLHTGWQPLFGPDESNPVTPFARRIWSLLPPFLPEIQTRLECWVEPRALQPCLCDIWHDHVLFTGDKVTGIIVYGSMHLDTPATDLARLLGSLVGDDLKKWSAGFEAYREVRPLDEADATLARVLDWTGVVLGAANWLHRLYVERRVYEDRQRVAKRMQELLERIEYFANSAVWAKAHRCL